MFRRLGRKVLGYPITVHSTRHALATTRLTLDPSDIEAASADWTLSPYIAAFFAFSDAIESAGTRPDATHVRVFALTRPKLAAFTHIVQLASRTVPAPSVEDIMALTRTTYDGPLVMGEDLMSFEIGDTVKVRRCQSFPPPEKSGAA